MREYQAFPGHEDARTVLQLNTPHRKSKFKLGFGIVIATLDLCCLPITYFYALNFDTNLGTQDG
jgi:hypothetical protein